MPNRQIPVLETFPMRMFYVKPRFVKLCFAMMSGRLIPTTSSINKDRAHLSWSINSRHWTYGFRSRVKSDGERVHTDLRWILHRKTQLFAHLMCTGEEFWRSPNVWKVSFWWMHSTILTWYTNHSLKWWKRRKSFNSMTSTFQEPGTSTTGGEGVDDGHHPSERRNRWFDYPITTLSPTVDHADNRVNEEAMMAWFEGYSNKTDTTSPADGSDMFETQNLSK